MDDREKMAVRPQGLRREYTTQKLWLFASLAGLWILGAVFAAYLCPYDPYAQDFTAALQAPSEAHLLGTDRYGRDMLSRVIMGGQVSIFSSLAAVLIMSLAGTLAGVCAGFIGGRTESVIMRLADIFLAFPGLVFAMAVAAVLQGGVQNAVLALAAIGWPKYARMARSQTLSVRQEPFIYAAQMAGSTPFQIIRRHIIPNIAGTLFVTAMLDIGTMMMEIAALSFLGLGAKPPAAEWGSMMNAGRSMLQTYPWVVLSPGAAIFISVAIFNLLGDTLRDYAGMHGRSR